MSIVSSRATEEVIKKLLDQYPLPNWLLRLRNFPSLARCSSRRSKLWITRNL